MNKWILIALTAVLILFGCTANRTTPKIEETEPYTGIVTKVAILPLKLWILQAAISKRF